MKQIDLEYYPYRWLRLKRKVTGHFPQNWGDVQARHLVAIACLYKGTISEMRLLEVMSGIPRRVLKRLSAFQRYKLGELIEFIIDPRARHELIIRKIRAKQTDSRNRQVLHAPKPKLKGVSFAQFIFTDTWFGIYQQSQKREDLIRFVASLYWPDGCTFEENSLEENAKRLSGVRAETLEAVAINWQLIHEWLSLSYPLIFHKAEKEDPEPESVEIRSKHENSKPNTENSGPDQNRWIKVFNNLVGDDVLNRDKWAETPVNVIFEYMTKKYKENAKRK